jgi:hypothetical protein
MATRMQQRRGTAAQWIAANPTLAAGEIGFETDTNQFKIGNGSSAWSALSYFKNLDGLDGVGGLVTLNAQGMIDIALIPQGVALDAELTQYIEDHNDETTSVHGISNTANLVYQVDLSNSVNEAISLEVNNRNDAISDAIGQEVLNRADAISDAIAQEVLDRNTAVSDAIALEVSARDLAIDNAIAQEVLDRDAAIGNEIATEVSDRNLAIDTAITTEVSDRNDAISTAVGNHSSDTADVHGIPDTSALATKTYADNAASAVGLSATADLTAHNVATTNVHGIADTAALATKTYADNAVSTAVGALTKSSVGLANVDNTSDANKPISTATQSALDLKAPLASPTFTGTVSGVTKAMVGLANVDNTADADKPVSTATQTALDAKASLSGATFTGSVEIDQNLTVDGNLTVNGTTFNASSTSIVIEDNMVQLAHQNAANTVDLGLVVAYNDGAAKHSGIVRDVSDDKWKLFKGVTTEPSTTVNFGQGSLDNLAVAALEATTVTPSSGVVFSDGTQTKEGVPSRTPITQKTAAYTLSALSERDSLIEVSHTGGTAVDITIPTNASVAYPVGTSIDILRTNTGGVRIVGASGVVVNSTPGAYLRAQWSSATLFKRATDTWVLLGDLATA